MPTTFDHSTRASLLLAAGDPANQEARAAFARCYEGLIREWCLRRGLQKSDQDDVTQTILCRLLEKLPTFKYDSTKRFRGLLKTMIHHAIADHYRVRQKRPGGCGSGDSGILGWLHEVPVPDDPAVIDLADELAGQVLRDQRLQEACDRICLRVKPHNWQAFWLTTIDEKSVAEVAQELGMTQGAVLVAKHRGIKMIRAEMAKAVGEEDFGSDLG